jgi:hypothetical protein
MTRSVVDRERTQSTLEEFNDSAVTTRLEVVA